MAPEKREGGPAPTPPARRIPVPPTAAPAEKGQPAPAKSGIPSPRRRSVTGGTIGRGKDVTSSAILSVPSITKQRPFPAPPASKLGKPASRPSLSQPCDEKDDIRQRDNGIRRDSLPRDKVTNCSIPRRPASAAEATNLTDAGKRLLLKSTAIACPVASPTGKAVQTLPNSKNIPRSVSTCRDRLAAGAGDARTAMVPRSMSVGKGRILANQTEPPLPVAAKPRPPAVRAASAGMAGAPYRPVLDRRDASAGRPRPLSAFSGKSDMSLTSSCKSTLTTIAEGLARPMAQPSTSTASKPAGPPRPILSLNLAVLKSQTVASPTPQLADPCISPSPDDLGPPVPKLDLGGILQRRAEEQASEPVFVVAASIEDFPQPSGSSAITSQVDKRKSGSRQTSAKEEPAEHFYLYPKVNQQEKRRIEDICRVVPRKQQAAITDLFGKMVEARQNCEQMCFRGHRLLDQAQAEFKTRLAQKEEEVAQKMEEAAQWRQEAEFLRTQLAMLLSARQQDSAEVSAQPSENQLEGGEDDRVAYLRTSVLSTFDSMAQLGMANPETYGVDGQGDADG